MVCILYVAQYVGLRVAVLRA